MQCICEKLGADFSELSPVCIGNLWLFRDLPNETLMAMSQSAIRYPKKRGERIFLEGDPADTMFLIKGGRIKLSKLSESGTSLSLATGNREISSERMFWPTLKPTPAVPGARKRRSYAAFQSSSLMHWFLSILKLVYRLSKTWASGLPGFQIKLAISPSPT